MEHSDNKPRLSDIAQDQILMRIRSGELPVGTRLPSEPELAQQMGISRGILREALNALQTRGYITRTPRGGSHIARPDVSILSETMMNGLMTASLRQLIDFREALETYAAQRAILNATDADIARLREMTVFAEQHSVIDSRDFHCQLAHMAKEPLFAHYIDFYFERMETLVESKKPGRRPKYLFRDIERILRSLEDRNARTMGTTVKRLFKHIRQYYKVS